MQVGGQKIDVLIEGQKIDVSWEKMSIKKCFLTTNGANKAFCIGQPNIEQLKC